ncbi:MAG: hypothetical protein ACAI38_18195 [Myxococcota bacterium]|nr:hypothetical protein [Myxococcota bacterium]
MSEAVVARVARDDIDKVLAPVGGLVPQQAALDGQEFVLGECGLWFDDNVVRVRQGDVRLANPKIDLVLTGGGFFVSISGDIQVDASLDVQLCALPDTSCDARVVAAGAKVVAQAFVAVNECVPQVSLTNVLVRIDGATSVDISGCPVYDHVFERLYDWFEEDLVAYAIQEVRNYIPELVADQVEALSANIVSVGQEVDGVFFKAQPESIAIDGGGITAKFAVGSEHYGLADCLEGVDWRREPAPPPPTWPTLIGTSVGVSQRFVQNTLESAWRAGWLCLDLAEVYPDADSMISGFGTNARMKATASTLQPPRVTFTPSETGYAEVDIGHLVGRVTISADDKRDFHAYILGGLTIGAETKVRRTTNEILIAPRSVDIRPFDIQLDGQDIPFTQADADRYVREEVAPVLAAGVAELPIVSSLFTTSLTPIAIERVHSIEGGLIADVHIGQLDTADTTPPTTTVQTPPTRPSRDTVDIEPTATDDTTPDNRMRYRLTIDDQRQGRLHFGRAIHIEGLDDSRHIIRIAAVDAMGNEDPVGVTYEIGPDVSDAVELLPVIAGGGCASSEPHGLLALLALALLWRSRAGARASLR